MKLDYTVNHERNESDLDDVVYSQTNQLQKMRIVRCACSEWLKITHFYRCLYCNECFCAKCAETHFGMTREQWTTNKNKQTPCQKH